MTLRQRLHIERLADMRRGKKSPWVVGRRRIVNGATKECSGCKIILPINKFRKRIQYGREYIVARCRKCEQEYNSIQVDREKRRIRERKATANSARWKHKVWYRKEYVKAHPDYGKKYYHADIIRARGYGAKYRDNNREFVRMRSLQRQKKNIENITKQYVKGLLAKQTGLAFKEIPAPLIKLKQLHIKAKRTIKLKQNESHRTTRPNVASTI